MSCHVHVHVHACAARSAPLPLRKVEGDAWFRWPGGRKMGDLGNMLVEPYFDFLLRWCSRSSALDGLVLCSPDTNLLRSEIH